MQVASKKVYWKNNRVFQTLVPYCHWKIYFIYQNLTDAFFQISLKYIKLVIPKILFILVLCSLIFTSKLLDPPNKINPPPPKKKFVMPSPPAKTFLKFWIPQAVEGAGRGGGGCIPCWIEVSYQIFYLCWEQMCKVSFLSFSILSIECLLHRV